MGSSVRKIHWRRVRLPTPVLLGFPCGSSGKESTCQCRRLRRHGFDSWVWKIPWRKKWQPTPIFLPGKSHGWRSLVGYSPWCCKELYTTEKLYFHYLFSTLWTVDRQAPLSMGFARQEDWSELLCPPPGNLPDPGSNLSLLHCRQILYPVPPGKP